MGYASNGAVKWRPRGETAGTSASTDPVQIMNEVAKHQSG
jgi:hypothetical protein